MLQANDDTLLLGIENLEQDAVACGFCPETFKALHDEVARIIEEKHRLEMWHDPRPILPYPGYCGKCPRCGAVFLDKSTKFCGNCGQGILFE